MAGIEGTTSARHLDDFLSDPLFASGNYAMLKHLIDPGAITRETLNMMNKAARGEPVEPVPLGEETVRRADPDRPLSRPHSDEESPAGAPSTTRSGSTPRRRAR